MYISSSCVLIRGFATTCSTPSVLIYNYYLPLVHVCLCCRWLHDVSRESVPPLHVCARLFADLCNRIEPFTFRVLPSKNDFGSLSDALKKMLLPAKDAAVVIFEPTAVMGRWDEVRIAPRSLLFEGQTGRGCWCWCWCGCWCGGVVACKLNIT